jgi:hypothetical protein
VILSIPAFDAYNPVFGRLRAADRPEADIQSVLDRLDALPTTGRVFTRLEWGEYLDWAGRPRRLSPFMDGRIEIYPDDVWRHYHAVTDARADWQAILDGRGVDYLLLDDGFHGELIPRVRASGRWTALARSGPATLYARTEPPAAPPASTTATDLVDTTDIQDRR